MKWQLSECHDQVIPHWTEEMRLNLLVSIFYDFVKLQRVSHFYLRTSALSGQARVISAPKTMVRDLAIQ